LWTDEDCVKLQSYDKLHIDVAVLDPVTAVEKWHFSGFNGEARRELRYRSWECLKMLHASSSLPWIRVGDFNEVLHANEQFGGAGRSEQQMEGFHEAVSVLALMIWASLDCRTRGIIAKMMIIISR
jgi:hypothetical protein